MNYKKALLTIIILAVLGIIAAFFNVYLIFIFVIPALMIRFAFYRCPYCECALRSFMPKYCHNCGEELEPQNRENNDE